MSETRQKVMLVREVVGTNYSGDHAIKKTQYAEAEIVWPNGEPAVIQVEYGNTPGPWQIAEAAPEPQGGAE